MPLKRPTKKTFTQEALQTLMQASAEQTGKSVRVRTYDENYPVFDIPVNSKLLVYVPNHTVDLPDGSTSLRMDKFAAHSTRAGKGGSEYNKIRCTAGLVLEEAGLDGSCPFCNAVNESWDLLNKKLDGIARQKGIDPNADGAKELLKADFRDLANKKAVDQATVSLTFPVVVIDCIEKDGIKTTNPKLADDGSIQGKVYWYTIGESTYNDKWVKSFDTAPPLADGTAPTNPAGMWFILNYTYDSKSGKHDKMGSAKALTVGVKNMGENYKPIEEYFDKLTEEWTPAKAMEVLVDNQLRDMAEQTEACDTVMRFTRDTLASFESVANAGVSNPVAAANATLDSFGATPMEAIGVTPVGAAPQAPIGVMPTSIGVVPQAPDGTV